MNADSLQARRNLSGLLGHDPTKIRAKQDFWEGPEKSACYSRHSRLLRADSRPARERLALRVGV